jgi:hypothetical protein
VLKGDSTNILLHKSPMFLLLIALAAFAVNAQPYPRTYLRGLKEATDIATDTSLFDQAVRTIENSILESASKGLRGYEQPFEGCDSFVKTHYQSMGLTVERCKKIGKKVYATIAEHFPDSEIVYDKPTKTYSISWD